MIWKRKPDPGSSESRQSVETPDEQRIAALRDQMVDRQLAARGITSPKVLQAFREVPRHLFVPQSKSHLAYEDTPLPIGSGQTISQPYIVAFMIEAVGLKGGEKVLEIGAGSGYALAVISRIAGEVFGVERMSELSQQARENLSAAGIANAEIRTGDGSLGWPEHAHFDAIIVSAGGPVVPEALKLQLKIGGRLVIPVGKSGGYQKLVLVKRLSEDRYETREIADVSFVPLIGEQGWR